MVGPGQELVVGRVALRQASLQLAQIAAKGGQQRVLDPAVALVVAAGDHPR